jgi:hypothetical protein
MDIQPFLDAFPLPGKRGILSDIDKAATDKAVDALIAKPAEAAKALADKLIDPGAEGNDIQARHALHAVAIRISTRGEGPRAAFCPAAAKPSSSASYNSAVGKKSPPRWAHSSP